MSATSRPLHIVVMGVSGCGKSSLGAALAAALGLPYLEGDAFHSAANVAKMHAGTPLTDADRAPWLQTLSHELASRPNGAVLACSALKFAYRQTLRSAVPNLQLVYLKLSPAAALERVAQRSAAATHFMPASLVESQFAALEEPCKETGEMDISDKNIPAGQPGSVLTLDAELSRAELVARAVVFFDDAAV